MDILTCLKEGELIEIRIDKDDTYLVSSFLISSISKSQPKALHISTKEVMEILPVNADYLKLLLLRFSFLASSLFLISFST